MARCLHLFVAILLIGAIGASAASTLKRNYYAKSCPNVEKIVRKVVVKKLKQTFVTLPASLRLFFHDAHNGCDASLMIASTPGKKVERDHPDNLSLAGDGFDVVMKAKEALEKTKGCKGKVSCADIMTIVARDAVVLGGGPSFPVELGRYDSKVSRASDVRLPDPDMNLDQLTPIYKKMNLSVTDMAALSMAHSYGFIHCSRIMKSLYNFNSTVKQDPYLNKDYAKDLKKECPKNVDPRIAIRFDPITPKKIDNVFYKNLINGLGLIKSDKVLYQDKRTRGLVERWANSAKDTNKAFVEAMIKLGRVGVKTKKNGEIRRRCDRFN